MNSTAFEVREKQPPTYAHFGQNDSPTTALYHCEACHAWWGKDAQPSNPLARFALFLNHEFSWENYYGWHTGYGIDYTCTVCGHPNPQMLTV
jgi:hypothetical protein